MPPSGPAAILLLLMLFSPPPAGAADPLSHSAQARELMGRGEHDRALEELERGASLYPLDLTLRSDLLLAYTQAAQREMKLNRYREAAAYYAKARELSPETPELSLIRGIALYYAKEYDAARADLLQAGELPKALVYLGKISYDTGDLPGALRHWSRALEQAPGDRGLRSLIEKAERELPVEERMSKGYSSMFDLSFDAELPEGVAGEVLDVLERAYNSVGSDLGLFPATRIPVLLYAKRDFSAVTAGPDWSGGIYDGKIRLPVGGATQLTPQMRAVLFHEFTHVVIAELTGGNIPTWLNEGIAEMQGRKEFAPPAGELARAAADGRLLPLSTLSGSFISMPGGVAGLAYQQSHSLADFIVSRYGWWAVQGILKQLGERKGIETAVGEALSDWSMNLPGVLREWRESLQLRQEVKAGEGS